MAKVAIIEDEKGLVETLSDLLESAQFQVVSEGDGDRALAFIQSQNPDLIILDLNLPGLSGNAICSELRKTRPKLPIIMLTAKNTLAEKVLGFRQGADDYITKPFESLELLARVEALLRRSKPQKELALDVLRHKLHIQGQEILLTSTECELLHFLARQPQQTISRDQLLEHVWDYQEGVQTRAVDVCIAALRKKIEKDPSHPQIIVTNHGKGYCLAQSIELL